MQVLEVDEVKDKSMETWPMDVTKERSSWSKILTHFIKGNIALSPMETLCLLLENLNAWKVYLNWHVRSEMKVWNPLIWWSQKNFKQSIGSTSTKVVGIRLTSISGSQQPFGGRIS